MNIKRYLLASISVFIATFILDFLFHGLLLTDFYQRTYELWRPQTEYKAWVMLLSQIGFAMAVVFGFATTYNQWATVKGLHYGVYLGVLLSMLDLAKYSYMPVPFALVLAWMMATMVKGIILGLIAALCYRCGSR